MKLTGRYQLKITGDTDALRRVSSSTFPKIGYLFERLLTGQAAAVESETPFWGFTVEQVDGEVEIPIIPQDQFAAEVLDATPEMIEAGWQVLDREGIEAPTVEAMAELFRAMERAR